ncbi:putative phosphoglycerate mutase [Lipingzhangella halophila]|uniref:Putative phosphoglycerate mutase n=1 Tax=Lipingzhangella halophila TaxID=1783352 RepID=A0A7W7W2R4_9ACTN|nr:bifunctional RNase H/acid phosphatase [Lipingzhangella halophila]MBB4932232.1 putative phosphoglycerate mutase [Lipingzhangella halophila]
MSRLLVEADGGSRGNPGPAGYGAVVRDALSGRVLAEAAESIETATNNVAEYQGLIAGLAKAAELDPDAEVEARLDSKLVVEQMSGRWKIKHPGMRPLAQRARDIAATFASVRYTWVPRAKNEHADRLANEAMDAAAEGRPVRLAPPDETGPGAEEPGPVAPATPDSGDTGPAGSAPPAGDAGAAPSSTGWLAPDTTPTKLLLLRHGETPLSAEKRFAGAGDIALTELGHAQARAAARRLAGRGIDTIVSSPLRRARDTAAHVARELSLTVRVDDGFREVDFGEWEGKTFAEVRRENPADLERWLADPDVAPPGGESFASAMRRVGEARDKLLARHRAETVLIVSHVTPIKTLLQTAMLAPPQALYRMHLDVGCLSEIDCFSDGPMVVRSMNDTAHLA